ncbi:MAG TPA: hypothetical protein PKC43_11980 [Phycisphaerales bacterium]|nr:hypothetical protein [Phycisphaerales bacterium]HMP38150.1 hypothetical protein [Phycisphaerales bacterium]
MPGSNGSNWAARRTPGRLKPGPHRAILATLVALAACALATAYVAIRPPTIERRLASVTIEPHGGRAWRAAVPRIPWPATFRTDSVNRPRASGLLLFEDGVPLGPAHALHATVAEEGAGRYSHWGAHLIFSTSDGSDPRTNGRIYELAAPMALARSAMLGLGLIAAALAVAIVVIERRGSAGRRGDLGAVSVGRKARTIWPVLPVLATTALWALFAVALASRWEVFSAARSVEARALSDNASIVHYLASRTTSGVHDFRVISLVARPLEQHAGPFRELSLPSASRSPRSLEVIVGDVPLERARTWQEFHEASEEERPTFYPTQHGIVLDLAGAPEADAVVRIPVRAARGTVVMLGGVAAIATAMLGWSAVRRRSGLGPLGAMRGGVAALAIAGVLLLGLNASSAVLPLRSPLVDDVEFVAANGLGPGDVRLDWPTARVQLGRLPGEDDAALAERMTHLVADSVAHVWIPGKAERLRLHVPASENWLIWLGGEVSPSFRNYRFADPRKAIERGVGMCGQVSAALTSLLRAEGLDARFTLLDGHAIVTLHVDGVQRAILDPDYGVVLPMSLDEARREAGGEVRRRYREALERLGSKGVDGTLNVLERAFAQEPRLVEPPGPVSYFGAHHAARERLLYQLRWIVPVALLLPALGALCASAPRFRRTGA